MSGEITTAMVDTYNTGIEMLAQQMESRLLGRVRRESEPGERMAFDQVGVVAARKRTTRHGDTQYINSPHRRRWVTMEDFEIADLLDLQDILRILNNPGDAYSTAFIAALNRQRDAEIIDAARRTAFIGKKGTDTISLPAGQIIPHGGTGFTLPKVATAMETLKTANAVDGAAELTIAWTAKQEAEFINTTEVKSVDYNTQRVLVSGGMDGEFYGFTYERLEDWTDELGTLHRILPKMGTVRSCMAWVRDGIVLNDPAPPMVRISQLPEKGYAYQYYGYSTFGCTRMQETKIVEIEVQEA